MRSGRLARVAILRRGNFPFREAASIIPFADLETAVLAASAAVECALAMQKQTAERNAEAPEAKSVIYRIGVHLGDVLIDGEDVLGDGVNIAARLEGVAEPGGVCVSGSAFDHVRGRVEAEFVDLGEKALKNIARPVRVFAANVGPSGPARVLSLPSESQRQDRRASLGRAL